MIPQTVDYAQTGLSIQAAFVDHARRYPDKQARPPFILWDGRRVMTADVLAVPHHGQVQAQFLHVKGKVEQGFDLKLDGWFELERGEHVDVLRTWYDPLLEDTVGYPFSSADERLRMWNVYKVKLPGGQVREDKWTGNAGFWVEELSARERIYHCSPGPLATPDFDALVLRILIVPTD